MVLHYGIGAGAGYALLPKRWPGTLFGLGLWLVGGEAAIGLSGVSNPLRKSARSHLSAALVHVFFGAVVKTLVAHRSPR